MARRFQPRPFSPAMLSGQTRLRHCSSPLPVRLPRQLALASGVLFLLVRRDKSWRIADLLRFTATGKEAEVSAELTAGTGSGYHLGAEGMSPVVTVKESHGGRGYAYQIYASYTFSASKLNRLELK